MDLHKLVVVGLAPGLLDEAHQRRLEARAGTVVTLPRGDERLAAELAEADGLIVGFAVPVPSALIDAAPRLRYLGVASTAYDVVDVAHARARGVTVTTLPGYNTEPVAQFVLAVMLEQACGLAEGRRLRAEGNFDPLGFPARGFAGSAVGVVGLGTIGRRVAEMAAGLGAHVSYWSRNRHDGAGYGYKQLRTLLAESDFVSINLALNAQTRGILDAELLRAVRPGAVLVGAAPMELVDLDALHARLAAGDGVRAVFNHALPPDLERFRDTPGFVTPPLVYLTPEAHGLMQDLLVERLETAAG
jgi:phosphoglycerate dehydrogenase-like enzyme